MIREHNILIASVGGQGGITLSRIIARAAMKMGYRVIVGETLGRGGPVQSHVRIGSQVYGPLIPEGRCHILIALEPVEALRAARYLSPESTILLNEASLPPITAILGEVSYPTLREVVEALNRIGCGVYHLNAEKLALEAGSKRCLNVVMLGAYMAYMEAEKLNIITMEAAEEAVGESVPSRYLEANLRALRLGYETLMKSMSGSAY
ncbi:indolepyruvate ferredoxin oxidoreductase subunit beta [Candidatus Bathyarchaeota archaeon]|nr:MAG: indolepyruvate ferredoxin oxidoreductase subunit beta [Candidatus Bathyarchaeota archaeon]